MSSAADRASQEIADAVHSVADTEIDGIVDDLLASITSGVRGRRWEPVEELRSWHIRRSPDERMWPSAAPSAPGAQAQPDAPATSRRPAPRAPSWAAPSSSAAGGTGPPRPGRRTRPEPGLAAP